MSIGARLTAIEFAIFINRARTGSNNAKTGFASTFHLSNSCHFESPLESTQIS